VEEDSDNVFGAMLGYEKIQDRVKKGY